MARRNLVIAIIFFLIGILCLILIPFNTSTREGREGYMINVNPRTFPYIMAIVMTGMGLYNVIIATKGYKKSLSMSPGENEQLETFNLKYVMPLFFIILVYTFFLSRLGYIICTVILGIITAWYFGARWWQAILSGFILSPAIYIVFTRVGVPLPRGILYFL